MKNKDMSNDAIEQIKIINDLVCSYEVAMGLNKINKMKNSMFVWVEEKVGKDYSIAILARGYYDYLENLHKYGVVKNDFSFLCAAPTFQELWGILPKSIAYRDTMYNDLYTLLMDGDGMRYVSIAHNNTFNNTLDEYDGDKIADNAAYLFISLYKMKVIHKDGSVRI